jgi:ribosomal protein S18 acetylase RimI-like enzyme
MMAAEREATRRGCVQIVLSTHSFQAPEFYESLGYIRLAAIPNYPKGHENILYIKYLQSSSDA